jgi:hypothetical protein
LRLFVIGKFKILILWKSIYHRFLYSHFFLFHGMFRRLFRCGSKLNPFRLKTLHYSIRRWAASWLLSIISFLDFNMSTFSWNGIPSIASDDADSWSSPGITGADKDHGFTNLQCLKF